MVAGLWKCIQRVSAQEACLCPVATNPSFVPGAPRCTGVLSMQARQCQWALRGTPRDNRDDAGSYRGTALCCAITRSDLGNPLRRVNRLEAAYLSDRRQNVRTVPTQAEPLRSCRVNLFCPSLYVGHVVDRRCSRMAAALHDISHWP